MWRRLPPALVLAATLPAAHPSSATGQLVVSDLHRVAAGPEVRDRPGVAVGPTGYSVFWETAPSLVPSTEAGRNYRILRQEVGRDGTLLGTPVPVMEAWSHQWGASVAQNGEHAWVAYYFADRSMRTGDRDLGLVEYAGHFDLPVRSTRLTRDPRGGPPVNHSSPALLHDPDTGKLFVASSVGAYRGDPRPGRRAYDSVNIEVRQLDATGAEEDRWLVRGPDATGEAGTPALTILPTGWRERYALAYVSNAGHRNEGPNGYSIYIELYDREWRVVGGRHLLHPRGGAARPALATVGDKLFIAWVDNGSNDVVISELDQNLHPVWPMHLRTALAQAGFAEAFGAGAPGLSAPTLFADGDRLGVAFVATWEWDPGSGRARQEIFLGRIAYR